MPDTTEGKIGASAAVYLPYSAYFPAMTARWAKEDGFSFLAGLPFRGLARIDDLGSLALPIRYIEGAWNPVVSLRQALSHKPTQIGDMNPDIKDWLFFPNAECSDTLVERMLKNGSNGKARMVVHEPKDISLQTDLLEISPRLDATIMEILELVRYKNIRLVFDTYHARRDVWTSLGEYGKPFKNAREVLERLIGYIDVIHVQPMRRTDELSRTLAGEETTMIWLLRLAKALGFKGDIVIEATLGIRGVAFWELRDMLRRLRSRVEQVMA